MGSARRSDMAQQTIQTNCVMDCPDMCGLNVTVEDGKVRSIRGLQEGLTAGFICSKVARFGRRLEHPDRLLHPMRRRGPKGSGDFERISWEEAVGEISSRVEAIRERWGGEAILPYHYGGSNGFLSEDGLDALFFARLGASRLEKTICAAPSTAVNLGMYGKMPGVAFEDYPKARFILIWGANPKASNIHLVPLLKKARKAGAFIAAVDPQRHFSDREIDLHLPVYPGEDLPLALAMIRCWHEKNLLADDFLQRHSTGLSPLLEAAQEWTLERAARQTRLEESRIAELADRYARSSPALLRAGWGTERNRNGGQALAAVLAMPTLLGKFGIAAGGFTMSNVGAVQFDWQQVFGPIDWQTRQLNMTLLAELLQGRPALDPPIKALFVYNCNPAVTVPDQNGVLKGLQRDDLFTVVHEQVMTDTALYADIVLPATTFLEHYEISRSYGAYTVAGARPVISPGGEARPNNLLFAQLGRAMGFADAPFQWDTQTLMEKICQALRFDGQRGEARILSTGQAQPYDFDGAPPVAFKTVFPPTADGKIHLTPPVLGDRPYHYLPLPESPYPLALISPASARLITSTLGEFNLPVLTLTLHPQDAQARGLADGERVRAFNELGEVICPLRVSGKVRPGVALLPKGAWMKASANRRTSTALCPDTINRVAGGACFNDARVEVEKG